MMRATPSINGLCDVGAVRVKALSLGCLDDEPDCWYLLRVADAVCILQLCNLVLVKPFACGQGCLLPDNPCPPPWGATAWLRCIIMVPIVMASILDKAE
jgi:hypothetical protein